jgi:hypothetical protein
MKCLKRKYWVFMFQLQLFFAPLWRMGPRCSSAETQVVTGATLLQLGITGHNFGRGPSKDHSTKVWLQLAQWFLRRRFKCESLRRTTDAKWWQKLTWSLARWAKKGAFDSVASDKVYQLLVHGRWFSPGTPASSTTKTGSHDIAEILLKVALKHQKSK